MSTPKLILIIRKDLKLRRGKEIAQCAHFIQGFISSRMSVDTDCDGNPYCTLEPLAREWLFGTQKKIVCQVDSEQELLDIYGKVKEAGLESYLIQDLGLTELKEKTYTACSIGPDLPEKIDPITSHLKLY